MGMTADNLIDSMKAASPKVVAWLLGLSSTRSVSENIALAELRKPDGTFDCREVLDYASTTRRRRTDRPGDRKPSPSGADSPSGDGTTLDYKRKLESKKLELQLLEAEKQVVSTQHVRDFLTLVASRLSQLGRTLQSQYGTDALLCLNEAVADLEQTVKRWDMSLEDEEITI